MYRCPCGPTELLKLMHVFHQLIVWKSKLFRLSSIPIIRDGARPENLGGQVLSNATRKPGSLAAPTILTKSGGPLPPPTSDIPDYMLIIPDETSLLLTRVVNRHKYVWESRKLSWTNSWNCFNTDYTFNDIHLFVHIRLFFVTSTYFVTN